MQLKHTRQAIKSWGKPLVSVVLAAVVTLTSVPISAFAPVMAYAQPLNPLVQKSEWGGVASEVGGASAQSATGQSDVTYTADGRPLYESASDTIYIYNALQTAVSRQEDAADQPVLTGDGDAETFGTGQPVYADGSDEPLTYGSEHTYAYVDGWDEGLKDAGENNNIVVNDEQNTAEKNEQAEKDDDAEKDIVETESIEDSAEKNEESDEVDLLADGDEAEAYNSLSGRDYVGQVTKQIGDETYILIGNEQQLRAIGSGKRSAEAQSILLSNIGMSK